MSTRSFRRDRERRLRKLALVAGAAAGATAVAAPAADAATYTVTTTADDNVTPPAGSLRAAIQNANATPGVADDIVFQSGLSGTINLVGAQLDITDGVFIHGPGAGALTVSGQGQRRVFNIATDQEVTLSGLTIANGYVYNNAGAGIVSDSAELTIESSVMSGNRVASSVVIAGWGGAVATDSGSLTVSNSTITGNHVDYSGTARGNVAPEGGWGGGIYVGPTTDAVISNSTISGNSAKYGGGVAFDESGNTLDINNSTIAGNNAGDNGGGIYHKYDSGGRGLSAAVQIVSTIVSGNTSPNGNDKDIGGGPVSAGFSLIQDPGGTTVNASGPNIIGQDPQLGGLANNGGPTPTLLPAATSPALDKGTANGLTIDQRGQVRTKDDPALANAAGGDGTDIGSVEASAGPTAPGGRPSCIGQEATIVGTNGQDTITGTDGRDVIKGLRGNDTIKSVGGDDIVCGDKGRDKIRTGDGDDESRGGDGGDNIKGGDGDDVLRGGAGFDLLFGGFGNDQLFGGAKKGKTGTATNSCDGGPGDDTANGCGKAVDVP